MRDRNFRQLLETRWAAGHFVCVGLDSDYQQIPEVLRKRKLGSVNRKITHFNHAIVEATHDLVGAYKPNIAFYAARGAEGILALKKTIQHIHVVAPEVPVILVAKRADIDNTNAEYVFEAFDYLNADAITVHPYLGAKALQPFLDRADKGVFVLCRTSNEGAGEFQDIRVDTGSILVDNDPRYRPLYQVVALHVVRRWNKNGNCGLVVGATHPQELREIRALVGNLPILIPGIGAQGGDVEATVNAGMDSRGMGMIINSSRNIIFASNGPDFAEKARRATLELHTLINQCRIVEA
jgi:orotidine-5'-phosphate decarboxylase